ncbi:hypothetical protein IB286_06935 [Spongiibacter sp. KMU-158]|uniref:GON domain-containing protein n=1 Tax=Spongiibacter pelagi TaxID=2760804 RepID=A0A927C103_9GAMM|nr:hypothetical protein [Spongiibacter pelagi]MBD2858744.1 hypothetical protein [Spongiibacter pelagi]
MNQSVTDKELKEPINLPTLLSGISVGTWQEDFPLTGRDFEHLKQGNPFIITCGHSMLLTSAGLALSLIGKNASKIKHPDIIIYDGEYVALITGLALSALCYLISLFIPSDKKKLMKRLKKHFDTSQKKRAYMPEGETEQ